MNRLEIRVDDLQGPEVAAFLQEHLNDMYATSPPESVHALDLDELRQPDITFWSMWEEARLVGCGALKVHSAIFGEIKSMRVDTSLRGRGLASTLLRHLMEEARARGMQRLSLETGTQDFFKPAEALYRKHGFVTCKPFADYREDPNSLYMTIEL